MKWINKGHEFDEVGKRFENLKRIYLYGAGLYGKQAADMLRGVGAEFVFVDRAESLQGTIEGIKVILPEELKIIQGQEIIVLTMGAENAGIVLKQLEMEGLKYGSDIYDVHSFLQFYIYIIALYRYGKCIMTDCTVMGTYQCSLKCKYCMAAIPYLQESKQVEYADFKRDVDILFENVDFVLEFGIGGGEMFLCKNLEQYIEYVMKNYSSHIWNCSILTNGTILPNEKVIETLKKYKLNVVVSRYSGVPNWHEKYKKLETLLQEHQIPVSTIDYENWVDMGWTQKQYKKNVGGLFDMCGMQCRIVKNGKLNYCLHGMIANEALYHLDLSEDEFDLCVQQDRKKFKLVEYHLGFLNKGCLEMCHYCNGYVNINQNTIPVAQQMTAEEYVQFHRKDR